MCHPGVFLALGLVLGPQAPDRPEEVDCVYIPPVSWKAALAEAAARGEIVAPASKPVPTVRTLPRSEAVGAAVTRGDLFLFEDTRQVLLTSFSDGELFDLMVDAANALMTCHGDNYDFIGFWLDFTADHEIGAAFYLPIENDVTGIGDPSTVGTPLFNDRPSLGLAGGNVEGFVMMWDVNHCYWQPGTGSDADFTRLALAQEFEHRFALFLPSLLDGRRLQGDDGSCGRSFHWNWKVDGQGSGMEISEWVGAAPAVPVGLFVTFNTDIPGGVFSYSDLYLMGYQSPAEMDAGNSELRYMNTSTCGGSYGGTITRFTSADIIAAAGARVPSSRTAQKSFRTGWVMIHLPGQPPSSTELDKAVAILDQHQIDWSVGTLGLGTMDDTLESCAVSARASVRNAGSNPQSYTATRLVLGGAASASIDLTTTGHSRGVVLGFLAPANVPLAGGQVLLLDVGSSPELLSLPLSAGPIVRYAFEVPCNVALCGFGASTQAVHLGGVTPFALSNAVDLVLGS